MIPDRLYDFWVSTKSPLAAEMLGRIRVRVPVDREHGFRLIVNTQSS
jgi:hypothetical protein